MGIRILVYRIALFALLREIRYSLSQMSLEPLAAAWATIFKALRDEWTTVLLKEITLLEALAAAPAAVDRADKALDDFAGRVSRAIDDTAAGALKRQLKTSLFNGLPLSKFRRPVLNGQLLMMEAWSSALANCGVPQLTALSAEAEALVLAGQKASEQRRAAQQNNREFRDVGMRRQFIDKVNATRKEAHGALGKLTFQTPHLAADFVDGFFYKEAPRDEEETIDDVKASINELKAAIDERTKQLEAMEAEAAVQAQAETERKAKEDSLAALEEMEADIKKKIAAAKVALAKK
jgi:hypothetical protein